MLARRDISQKYCVKYLHRVKHSEKVLLKRVKCAAVENRRVYVVFSFFFRRHVYANKFVCAYNCVMSHFEIVKNKSRKRLERDTLL